MVTKEDREPPQVFENVMQVVNAALQFLIKIQQSYGRGRQNQSNRTTVRMDIDRNSHDSSQAQEPPQKSSGSLTQNTATLRVDIAPNSAYTELFQSYGTQVVGQIPAERTLQVAQQALRQGHPLEEVVKILRSDPTYKALQTQKGTQKAEWYITQAAQAAQRKTLLQQQDNTAQIQRQNSRGFQLER